MPTLGLGSQRVDPHRLAWPLLPSPDQVADSEGTPIAAFPVQGERPLDYGELQRVLRRPACLECHAGRPPIGSALRGDTPEEADSAHRERLARCEIGWKATEAMEQPEPGEPRDKLPPTLTGKEAGSIELAPQGAAPSPTRPVDEKESEPVPKTPPAAVRTPAEPELSPFIGQ